MKKLIDKLRKELTNAEQNAIFSSDNKYDGLLSVCKSILLEGGYKVIDPVDHMYNVTKVQDLIELFYGLLGYHHPELINSYKNNIRDSKIAKDFVDSRMKAGSISKKESIKECADIIGMVFKHESEFKFTIPISFSMFGQGNMKWITDKAIEILNVERGKREAEKHEERLDKLIKDYDGSIGMFTEDELNEIMKR